MVAEIKIILKGGEHYIVPDTDIRMWSHEYPNVDVPAELRKMGQWSRANPPKRKTRRGVQRFIVNWLNGTSGKQPKQAAPFTQSHRQFEKEKPKKITKEVGQAGLAALKEAMKK